MIYTSLSLKTRDLKFGMHVIKKLLYFITDIFWFFRRIMRVGGVLSKSELDPFLNIWLHAAPTLNGISPCGGLVTAKFLPLTGARRL